MVSKFELKLKSYPLIVDDLSSQPNNHELFQLAEPPELAKETCARCNDFEQFLGAKGQVHILHNIIQNMFYKMLYS